MFIHWFPGHMTKALREMEAQISKTDCVVYVLDARIPESSVNPAYDSIIGNKPRLYVLNKADLVPQNELNKWRDFYSSDGNLCIVANSTIKGGNNVFISALNTLAAPIIEKYAAKGVKKTVRAMVIGVPNCGKSTLINSLTAKKRTVTGNRPGVTRGQQWVSIDKYVDLLDTPGTLFPDFSDQNKAVALAIAGSIKDDLVDSAELAYEILRFLKKEYPDRLLEKYNLETMPTNDEELLEAVAKRRGFIVKGGEYDLERTSKAIIQDFRKQAFGKIIFEKR